MKETLGQVLTRYLELRKMSAYRLGKLTGISQPTISGIKNDRHGASMEKLGLIASALDAPIDEFVEAATGLEFEGKRMINPYSPEGEKELIKLFERSGVPEKALDCSDEELNDLIRQMLFKVGATVDRIDDKTRKHRLMLLRNLHEMYYDMQLEEPDPEPPAPPTPLPGKQPGRKRA